MYQFLLALYITCNVSVSHVYGLMEYESFLKYYFFLLKFWILRYLKQILTNKLSSMAGWIKKCK